MEKESNDSALDVNDPKAIKAVLDAEVNEFHLSWSGIKFFFLSSALPGWRIPLLMTCRWARCRLKTRARATDQTQTLSYKKNPEGYNM